jgi:hypothetical protein
MLVFGGALVASAQQPAQTPAPQAQQQSHARGARGRKHGDPSLKGIKLSAAEQANIKSVHAKYASQMKAIRAQGKSDATRQQSMQLMKSERAELRNGLSSENQAKYDANVAKMEQRMAKRGQHTPGTNSGV